MKLRSHTQFPAFGFQKYNPRQELMGCATVSGTFEVVDGLLHPVKEQPPIALSDSYCNGADAQKDRESAGSQALASVSDFVPYRPATDVTIRANAQAPGDQPQPSWRVGVLVGDRRRVLCVHGARHWYYEKRAGWRLSDAIPAREVPMTYDVASGGKVIVPDDHPETGNVDVWNPIGPGVLHRDTPQDIIVPAAQIEHPDRPLTDAFVETRAEGFAPIAPVWRFREQFVGTYDEHWLKTQHPFLPPDFDPRFYNVAHPALQFDPYLRGDEIIRLANLFPGQPELAFYLPGIAFGAVATHDGGATVRLPMALDGVHLDLLGERPEVRLTWRASFPWRNGISFLDIGPITLPSQDYAAAAAKMSAF